MLCKWLLAIVWVSTWSFKKSTVAGKSVLGAPCFHLPHLDTVNVPTLSDFGIELCNSGTERGWLQWSLMQIVMISILILSHGLTASLFVLSLAIFQSFGNFHFSLPHHIWIISWSNQMTRCLSTCNAILSIFWSGFKCTKIYVLSV
jgi:hypothetical protein